MRKENQRKRELAWVARAEGIEGSWRPRKRQRRDAWRLLCMMDNQLKFLGTSLQRFKAPSDEASRGPWHTWPILSWCFDQGSPEMSATAFLEYSMKANFDLFCDPEHGSWRDAQLAIKRSGHFVHHQLYLAALNVPHGPWSEDVRWAQVTSHLKHWLDTTSSAEQSPLFLDLCERMAWDQGDSSMMMDGDLPQRMLSLLRSSDFMSRKGSNKT